MWIKGRSCSNFTSQPPPRLEAVTEVLDLSRFGKQLYLVMENVAIHIGVITQPFVESPVIQPFVNGPLSVNSQRPTIR